MCQNLLLNVSTDHYFVQTEDLVSLIFTSLNFQYFCTFLLTILFTFQVAHAMSRNINLSIQTQHSYSRSNYDSFVLFSILTHSNVIISCVSQALTQLSVNTTTYLPLQKLTFKNVMVFHIY